MPLSFRLPDLISACSFPLEHNRHRNQVTTETIRWILRGTSDAQLERKVRALRCGTLTAMCYPQAAFPQLRVCNDFLTYLFHLDDISDDMDTAGAKATGEKILGCLKHPLGLTRIPSREQRMTQEYVSFPKASQNSTNSINVHLVISNEWSSLQALEHRSDLFIHLAYFSKPLKSRRTTA